MNIKRDDLLPKLSEVAGIASKRSSLPILNSVHLRTELGFLRIRGSDMVQDVIALAPCEGELEALCVSADHILSLVRSASDAITLTVVDGKLIVKGNGTTKLGLWPVAEYPADILEKQAKIGVNGSDLADGIEAVLWSASTDKGRDELRLVHCATLPKEIVIMAANGASASRFSRASVCAESSFDVLAEFARPFADALRQDGAVLCLGQNHIGVKHDGGCYFLKRSEFQFPAKTIERMCADVYAPLGEFDVKEWKAAVGICLSLSPDSWAPVKHLFGAGVLFIEYDEPKRGNSFTTHIAGATADGNTFADANRLGPLLGSLGVDKVTVKDQPTALWFQGKETVALLGKISEPTKG